jgi:tetratricopeptide (TPR) repeat protein
VLDDLGYPFRAGIATAAIVENLNAVLHEVIYSQKPLPLPVSFLIDDSRKLRAIYKGPLKLDDLIVDLQTLASPPEEIQDRFVPFPGRYSVGLFVKDPVTVARIYLEGEYPEEAREYLEHHLENAPDASTPAKTDADRKRHSARASVHHLLGNLLEKDDLPERAIEHYRATLRIVPGFSRAANDLAWLRATHPDPAYRDGGEAVRLASQACQSTRFEVPEPLDTLAAAYAESGKFKEAIEIAESAVASAAAQGRQRLAEEIRQRLDLYRRHQPFRRP